MDKIDKDPKKMLKDVERAAINEYVKKYRAEERKKFAQKVNSVAKTVSSSTKYAYVRAGHAKNELLGYFTVFNLERSFDVQIIPHVKYASDDEKLYLNIYQPLGRDLRQKLPVFVYVHGGGWVGGLPETREGFTTRVAAAGYFVVSLFYGHSPMYAHPKPLENIYKAFAWLKDNAWQYNVDTDEIFVGGESAGAHMTSMVGAVSTNAEYNACFELDERSRWQKVRGLMLNCGVFDMERAYGIKFHNIKSYIDYYCGMPLKDMPKERRRQISSINYVTADYPPTLAISAANDPLSPLTYEFVSKLDALGVNVRHFHANGALAVHAFAVAPALDITKSAMSVLGEFMYGLQLKAGKDYKTPEKSFFE